MRLTDVIKLPCTDDSIVFSASISALLTSSLGRYSLTGSDTIRRNDRTRFSRNRTVNLAQSSMMHSKKKIDICFYPSSNNILNLNFWSRTNTQIQC